MLNHPHQSKRNVTLLKVYADLVQLYPENINYIRQYAKLLLKMDQLATGTEMLRHLHSQWLKNGEPGKADALAKQYPMIGRIRESVRSAENIQPLLPAIMQNRLWLRLHRKRLREGQHLFHSGDRLDSLYLVCEGELAEFSEAADGTPILLNLIQAGDVVAENALLNTEPQPSDVVANKPSIVIKLPRKKMMVELRNSPELVKYLERKIAHRHVMRCISASPVLQIIPLDMRQHLAEDSHIQTYPQATTIHNAGETLSHVDLIIQGEAQYQLHDRNSIKQLERLKPGALIGESAAVHDTGCPADMVTQSDVTMLHIAYAAFINVVEAYPPLRQKLTAYTEAQRLQLMRRVNELQTQELN